MPNQRRPSPIQGVRAPRGTKVDADVTGGDFIPADRGISVNREMTVATIWRTGGAARACAAMRQLDKGAGAKILGGLVCRFQLGNVHRKIKHYLDRFGVGMGVIVAVNVHLELPTVANDPLPPRLE